MQGPRHITAEMEEDICARFNVSDPLLIKPEVLRNMSEEDSKIVRALQTRNVLRTHELPDLSRMVVSVDNMAAVVEKGNVGLVKI